MKPLNQGEETTEIKSRRSWYKDNRPHDRCCQK